VHRGERLAQPAPFRRAEGELFDGVEPIANRLEREERPQEPGAQQPPAHGRARAIDLVEERPLHAPFAAADHFEMAERDRVDDEALGGGAIHHRAHVRQVGFLRVAQIVRQRTGGHGGGMMTVEAEPFEAVCVELPQQRPVGGVGRERGRIEPGDRQREPRDLGHQVHHRRIVGDHQLARAQHGDLVGERLQAGVTPVFGGTELAGREVHQRRAHDVVGADRQRRPAVGELSRAGSAAGDDGHQERRLARFEVRLVGEGAGGDYAHHLALDHPLGGARILHLLADGDPEPLAHEPGDIAVGRMMRHATHRDPVAAGVLGARRQREVERARRREGVFVEHLVEVAHPEEDDGVAVLALGFEVLPHRRRDGGGGGHRWGCGYLEVIIA
jgi:hypothetical protein